MSTGLQFPQPHIAHTTNPLSQPTVLTGGNISSNTGQEHVLDTSPENDDSDFEEVYAAALPPPYSREAPSQFKGSYTKVEHFVKHYERLLVKYNIRKDKDKCEGILDYCSSDRKSVV